MTAAVNMVRNKSLKDEDLETEKRHKGKAARNSEKTHCRKFNAAAEYKSKTNGKWETGSTPNLSSGGEVAGGEKNKRWLGKLCWHEKADEIIYGQRILLSGHQKYEAVTLVSWKFCLCTARKKAEDYSVTIILDKAAIYDFVMSLTFINYLLGQFND